VKWLLWLYPASWRRRYRPEMEALLEESPATPRGLLDLLRGALDAWLHPLRRPRRARAWRYLSRPAWFAGLLALRLCVDGGVASIGLGARSGWRAALLAVFAAWVTLDALVLRRGAGFRWRRALTAGLALELLVGPILTAVSGLAHVPTLGAIRWPSAPGLLGEVLWAAVLAVMLARRRGWWNWNGDGRQGAPVPARPLPDAPPALTAAGASRGSGRRSDLD
jgi:hypothetical protein